LILDACAERAMRGHGEEGYPQEVCGLLIGRAGENPGSRRVVKALRAGNRNRERAADRYELDPADYLRIEAEARRLRLEIVGVYHSHPDHPSRPSETDRLRAEEIWQSAESWSYLILEIAAGKLASRRSWILENAAFREEVIRIEASET
jgi:proteasome lid subunit RPN8/RPN11